NRTPSGLRYIIPYEPVIRVPIYGAGNRYSVRYRVREERSEAPRLHSRRALAPQAEIVQVAAAVVTEQAVQVGNAEKRLGDIGRFLIDVVLHRIVDHPSADEPIQLALRVGILPLRRD